MSVFDSVVDSLQESLNEFIDSQTNPNSTISQITNGVSADSFSLNFTGGQQIEDILSVLLIIIGTGFVFFGCRLFKITLFSVVVVATAALGYYVAVNQHANTKIVLPCAIVGGIFLGFLSLKLFKLALFAVGAVAAFVIWAVLKSMYPAWFTDTAVMYVSLILPVVICGIISVYMEQYWLLIGTPIIGSFFLAQGIDHFAGLGVNVFYTLAGDNFCTTDKCWSLWGSMIGLSLIGMLVQYHYTSGLSDKTKTVYKVHEKERYVRMPKKMDV